MRKTYPIETGIERPDRAVRTYYPWYDLSVGGSFLIEKEQVVSFRSCRQNVYAANRRFKDRGDSRHFSAWREFKGEEFIGMRVQRDA